MPDEKPVIIIEDEQKERFDDPYNSNGKVYVKSFNNRGGNGCCLWVVIILIFLIVMIIIGIFKFFGWVFDSIF